MKTQPSVVLDLCGATIKVTLLHCTYKSTNWSHESMEMSWDVGYQRDEEGKLSDCVGTQVRELNMNHIDKLRFTNIHHFIDEMQAGTCIFHLLFPLINRVLQEIPAHERTEVYCIVPHSWSPTHKDQLRRIVATHTHVVVRAILDETFCFAAAYISMDPLETASLNVVHGHRRPVELSLISIVRSRNIYYLRLNGQKKCHPSSTLNYIEELTNHATDNSSIFIGLETLSLYSGNKCHKNIQKQPYADFALKGAVALIEHWTKRRHLPSIYYDNPNTFAIHLGGHSWQDIGRPTKPGSFSTHRLKLDLSTKQESEPLIISLHYGSKFNCKNEMTELTRIIFCTRHLPESSTLNLKFGLSNNGVGHLTIHDEVGVTEQATVHMPMFM